MPFDPWVGRDYGADLNRERLLVLGESHYGPANMPTNSTITLTQQYVQGKFRHRFWTNIMQVVTGRPYWTIDREAFWNGIAFYNYVQMPVGEGPGIAPTSEMFALSEPRFLDVLRETSPNVLLVLSKRLWVNIPRGFGQQGPTMGLAQIERETWIYSATQGSVLASWIPHPSYGFSWRRWNPCVQDLITRAVTYVG